MTTVAEIVDLKRRALSLERRLRDMKPLKYLHQLLDVDITYDGPGEVQNDDVLTYDATAERWVAAPGGGGAYSTALLVGDTSPTSELQWARASSPGLVMASWGGGDGIEVAAAGIYSVEVTAYSSDVFDLRVFGPNWQWLDEDPPACRQNPVIYEQSADGTEPRGGSGASQMALPAGGVAEVQVLDAVDTVYWSLSVHLVCLADVDEGTCG